MKLSKSDIEKSERLAEELKTFDSKNKGKLEADIKEADTAIMEGKAEFDRLKLLGAPGLWEAWGDFERLLIRRRQLSENYLTKKTTLEVELRKLTVPYISVCVEFLLREVPRIDALKRFEITTDKENPHSDKEGSRLFSCRHNYFKCHLAMKEILGGIDELKASEFESLSSIEKKYNTIVEAIPTEFEFETSEGNERLREFFFENKPKSPGEVQEVYMHQVIHAAELAQKVAQFERERPAKQWAKEHEAREIDMSKPKGRPIFDL